MASIVFAGGGSAGHIEPALAVARKWRESRSSDEITFLGTQVGLENSLVPAAGFKLSTIPKVSIARKISLSLLKAPLDLIFSVKSAADVLKDADLLIGFGGYVSGPAYIAAALRRIPIVIHEANAKPGLANKLGALFTKNLGVAYEVKKGAFSRATLVGLPLRSDVEQALVSASQDWKAARKKAKERLGFSNSLPLIFIMGGSQGSVAINKVVSDSLGELSTKNISILHSVGTKNELPKGSDFYRPVPYVEAMADAYLASDVIIARSGAVTCSEFKAVGRYAMFIPLPIGNGEQFFNAQGLVADGRAMVVTQQNFTSQYLLTHLDQLLDSAKNSPIEGSQADSGAAMKIMELGITALGANR